MSEINEVEYDEYGFNASGVHEETNTEYDTEGFNANGIHCHTGTAFGPNRLTRDGHHWDDDGYNAFGFDREGYDSDGYDGDGYNEDGEDCDGDTRCDNGECEDSDCERCNPNDSFEDQLHGYGERAPRVLGWAADPALGPKYMYAGHEIEMYSDDEDFDDVLHTLSQVDDPYRKLGPLTSSRRCAIAKHDGSLNAADGGFELVTVPLTTLQVYGIFQSFKTLGSGRCSAWDKGMSVGHHIHLTRAAIGPLTLGKLFVFMNAEVNRRFLEAIAGRPAEFNAFSTKKLTDVNAERYEVLNVTNSTVEFRLFRSNLYSKAILKNHEFAVAAVLFCEQASHGFGEVDSAADPLHFRNFRSFVAWNRNTFRYLHEYMMAHPAISSGYRLHSPLPESVKNPKEQSPMFRLIRTEITGA